MDVKKNNDIPSVVIFGRANVGKSTLFNCLTESKRALTADIPGTTRDANIGTVEWENTKFRLVDTGGILDIKHLAASKKKRADESAYSDAELIDKEVQERARDYLAKADLIIFLTDVKSGLLPQDKEMAKELVKIITAKDKIILAANKADSPKLRREISDFYKLSLGEPMPVSAATGSGTGDLLDLAVKKLKNSGRDLPAEEEVEEAEEAEMPARRGQKEKIISISIMGKPNTGKSSLLNSLLNEKRVITSPVAHTTREPQDTDIEYKGMKIKLIDTAGISKKGSRRAKPRKDGKSPLEKYGIEKSLSVLRKSDIALFILDISEDITKQDAKIADKIIKSKNSVIIIANKWDLVKDKKTEEFKNRIRAELPFLSWAPILFASALTGLKVNGILDLAADIREQRKKEIPENQLDKFLKAIIKRHRPAKGKGTKHPYIRKMKQEQADPPFFSLRIGSKDNLHFSYLRFIQNRLREKYGFLGTPITLYVEKNKKVHGKRD